MKALYEKRGDGERQNIQTLASMKQTIGLQEAGLAKGIFILSPEDASHLQSSIIAVFNYAERILLPQAQNPSGQPSQIDERNTPGHSRASSATPANNSPALQTGKSVTVEKQDAEKPKQISKIKQRDVSKPKESGSPPKSNPLSTKKVEVEGKIVSKDTIDPADDFVPIQDDRFDSSDFPVLGAKGEPKKPKAEKIEVKRIEKKGNQKQRRVDVRTDGPLVKNTNAKLWTRQENGEAIAVESPSVPRSVFNFNYRKSTRV